SPQKVGTAAPRETPKSAAATPPKTEPTTVAKAEPTPSTRPSPKGEGEKTPPKTEPAKSEPAKSEPAKTAPAASQPSASTAADADAKAQVAATVDGWAKAWSNKDVKGYLSYYAADFEVPKGSRAVWEKERAERISRPKSIAVEAKILN